MEERKILIIYTGGTIGMVIDPETNSLVPFDFESISKHVPELRRFDFQVKSLSFEPLIDSSDMHPDIWIKLVGIIEENYSLYDGFVILHGTDTMAYTASALSFMLQNLKKPVVLTGSQLPLGTIRTDGKENLITALEIAAAQKNRQALVPEVCIYFKDKLFRGNRTTKYNAEHFNAFRSDNYPPLAEAGIHLKYNYPYIRYTTLNGTFRVSKKMDTNVALLRIFPGINKDVVKAVLNAPNIKAVVLETYGSGNAPTTEWFLNEIKEAVERGLILLNVTQCLAGSVEMWRYETGVHMLELGVVSGYDMTTEAAVTKLMYLLANCSSVEEVKKELNRSLQGEIHI
ncbi:type I asparaginase [Carboxylicivirga sediminis]|uniref:asparaginase n=1 Tax=Carboxylicivirga sediminis TaxID=2006564 RepID=A0A941F0I4_9BACT|nr:type I asparaginase [Carboxylicivirga sediminis]MBR8534287.1 type I asparaginase [Carboxylicivirga sediminis]